MGVNEPQSRICLWTKVHHFSTLTLANLFEGTPKILKPVLDTPFQGLLQNLDHFHNLRVKKFAPEIVMGVAPPPKKLDPISKITPISDLLSYKGCLSVERPRTVGGGGIIM